MNLGLPMKGLHFVLLFTAMTFIAWGTYGPLLRHGTHGQGEGATLRAFVAVGLAYFFIAVVIPLMILRRGKEPGNWTTTGIIYSIVAGAVGALGALGIILALDNGGDPIFVMPIVFGFAPVVNTLVTAALGKTFAQIRPIFVAGIVTAALGAVGVLVYSQQPAKSQPVSTLQHDLLQKAVNYRGPLRQSESQQESDPAQQPASDLPQQDEVESKSNASSIPAESKPVAKSRNNLAIALSILMAALCWGSYGPMLHIGQSKMSGSRLRPFICVGIAYFLIAVLVPLGLLYGVSGGAGSWNASGMTWAFIAGVAGAVGALGVILAFNAGGKPIYVMPLVFGFAPVINTSITLSEKNAWGSVPMMFWISLAAVITGAVTVLITAPKPKPKPST